MTKSALQPSSNVVSLVAFRAARAARQAPLDQPTRPVPPPSLLWRLSSKGNHWCKDLGRTEIHVVIYKTSRGWSGRYTAPAGEAGYLNQMTEECQGLGLTEAKDWVAGWLAAVERNYTDRGRTADKALTPGRSGHISTLGLTSPCELKMIQGSRPACEEIRQQGSPSCANNSAVSQPLLAPDDPIPTPEQPRAWTNNPTVRQLP